MWSVDVDDFAVDTTCIHVRNGQGPKSLPRWPQLAERDFTETRRPLAQHQLGLHNVRTAAIRVAALKTFPCLWLVIHTEGEMCGKQDVL